MFGWKRKNVSETSWSFQPSNEYKWPISNQIPWSICSSYQRVVERHVWSSRPFLPISKNLRQRTREKPSKPGPQQNRSRHHVQSSSANFQKKAIVQALQPSGSVACAATFDSPSSDNHPGMTSHQRNFFAARDGIFKFHDSTQSQRFCFFLHQGA